MFPKALFPILISSLLLLTNFQCQEDYCEGQRNEASLQVSLSPEKIDYVIGDTILIGSKFGTSLPLTNRNQSIDIQNGMCYLGIFIMKLGLAPDSLRGYSDFDIINYSGNLSQDIIQDSVEKRYEGYINFNCTTDTCEFQFGLVPKVKGKYCLSLYIGGVEIQDTSLCPDHNVFHENVFTVSSLNREILEELHIHSGIRLPNMYGTGGWWEIAEKDGSFAFRVK